MNTLLLDIFSELSEPLLVVNCKREVIFRSRSFSLLCGDGEKTILCQTLILPPTSQDGQSCCWSALDAYLDCHEHGLWQIVSTDGKILPMLCELLPIGIRNTYGMLAIKVRPLRVDVTPVAQACFSGIRYSSENDENYFHAASEYMKSAYGIGFSAWFHIDPDSRINLIHANGLKDVELSEVQEKLNTDPRSNFYDIIFRDGKRTQIAHVICEMDSLNIAFVFGGAEQHLEERLVDAAHASILALRGRRLPISRQSINQTLNQTLSNVERETLHLLSKGLSDKEIAKHRGVSLYTVKHQVSKIMKKAGVNRRVKLVNYDGQ